MAMLRAFVKNGFLNLETPEEAILRKEARAASDRARSEGPLPCERGLASLTEEQELFMHRLNSLLECDRSAAQELLICQSEQVRVVQEPSPASCVEGKGEAIPTVDELRQLQRRLSELAGAASKLPAASKPLLRQRVMSNSSVSTMAEEEGEEVVESPLQKTMSSASVSSMASWEEQPEMEPVPEEDSSPAVLKTEQEEEETPSSRVLKDFTHPKVPRRLNLAEEFLKIDPEEPPTTMMLRNIPNRYTQRDLIRELEKMGFAGTFDFLYLPIDKGTMCNVGYAFVNFVDPAWASRCMELLENYHFKKNRKGGRGKFATVSVAHIQGLEANVKHYEKSAVSVGATPRLRQRGPVIVSSMEKPL